ncbi:MAG: penicillin-binding protein 2 [bacterium]|nr:penicillin-binding protein 2 [bacterium]
MAKFSGDFRLRFRITVILFFLVALILVGQLFSIQIAGRAGYAAKAERQYASYQSKASISIRGDIYFQEKNANLVSAATVRDGFLVSVNPKIINDPEKVCGQIVDIVPVNKEECIKKSLKKDDPSEQIAHRLNLEQAEKIKKLNLKGVEINSEQWRFYPGNNLASHILGFVGYNGDDLIGRYGVEEYHEDALKGKNETGGGSFASLFFELGKELLASDVSSGRDLVLTIEPQVQSILEESLRVLQEKWKTESSGGIIIDPRTGAIIAMAAEPDFNPNFYGAVKDISLFKNPLVSDLFEMGSVVKPLTLAAALDTGAVKPDTIYTDNGFLVIDKARIENYDGKSRGRVDMQEVLNQSLNTGAVFAMRQLGKKNFRKYMSDYGLGEKTGLDVAGEVKGDIRNLNSPRELEYANAAFGQGIAVTPIEFASAVSALANQGILMKPYVVSKVMIDGEKDKEIKPQPVRQVIKKETAEAITRMLVKVVDTSLMGGTVKMERYSIAAKTGTAQISKKDSKGYSEDQYLHSFFGYAPAYDPRFLIFLYLEKPQGVQYAAYSLTPSFMELMKFLLNYYEVPPDR